MKKQEIECSPGPWQWETDIDNNDYCLLVDKDGNDVVRPSLQASDGGIGAVYLRLLVEETDKRLIRAAPDLLFALRIAERWLKHMRTKDLADACPGGYSVASAFEAIENAISSLGGQ